MTNIYELYDQKYDFPFHHLFPRAFYMLASTPRSGSTLAAILLWRTGMLGSPMEYLNFQNSWFVRALTNLTPEQYWADIRRRRTSPNGIFGLKMFIRNYHDLRTFAPEFLPLLSPDVVLHLVRRDRIAQAVSYYRAIATQAWFFTSAESCPLEYDREGIARCEAMIAEQEAGWAYIFRTTGCEPIQLVYEDIVSNPTQELERVLSALGANQGRYTYIDIPLPRIQRDDQSIKWAELYRSGA